MAASSIIFAAFVTFLALESAAGSAEDAAVNIESNLLESDGALQVSNKGQINDAAEDDPANFFFFGFSKTAVINFSTSGGNGGATGSLTLTQANAFAAMSVQGTISGLTAGQVINVHIRKLRILTSACTLQGSLYNPFFVSTGGFLVKSATADATGAATISASVPATDATLFGLWSIALHSARIATGASNSAGTILACGTVNLQGLFGR